MAVLRGAAGWIIRQAAAMQAAGGRRWWACPSRWAALAAGAAAVRSGKACRLWALCRWGRAGAGAWSSCAAVCFWRGHLVRRWRCRSFPVQVAAGAICCGCGVLEWPSWQRRQHSARAGLLIRQAGQVAGGKAAQKKKARAAARRALLLWPSVCTGGAICCAGCVPVHIVGGGCLLPVPVPALIRLHLIHLHGAPGTGAAGTVPPGQFCRLPEGSDSPLYRVVLYV